MLKLLAKILGKTETPSIPPPPVVRPRARSASSSDEMYAQGDWTSPEHGDPARERLQEITRALKKQKTEALAKEAAKTDAIRYKQARARSSKLKALARLRRERLSASKH